MVEKKEFTKEQKDKIEKCFREFLSIIDDPKRPGLIETPHRVMKYWTELLEGQLYTNQEIAEMYDKCFDLDSDVDEDDISLEYNSAIKRDLVVETNIPVFSHCFDKDTRILNPESNHKTISQFKIGDLVTTFNPETGKLENRRVTFVHKNKAKDWVKIRIGRASTLVTPEHPYFDENFNQILAKDLKIGDKVWSLRTIYRDNTSIKTFNRDYDLGYILGALLSDGSIWRNTLKLQVTEEWFADKFKQAIYNVFGLEAVKESQIRKGGFKDTILVYQVRITNSQICSILNELCNGKYKTKDFDIPRIIFDDFDIFKGFYEAYLDGDGSEFSNPNKYQKINRLISTNKIFIEHTSQIFDRILHKPTITNGGNTTVYSVDIPLFINDRNLQEKQLDDFKIKFENELKNSTPTVIYPDIKLVTIEDIKNEVHTGRTKHGRNCYNLEIEGNHTYFANNIYVHNCEHHLALMYDMKVAIAYIPKHKVIGLSKMGRIAEMCAKRLQLQEKLGNDINEVMRIILGTDDVAVIIEGKHGCMTARGIKCRESVTKTACLMGRFKTIPALREEMYSLVKG